MPIGLLLALGVLVAGGAYAYSQRDSGEGPVKKKGPPPPKTLSEQLGPKKPNPKVEAVKAKIETLKAKAAQGDKDAGKALDALRTLYGNLTK